MGLTTVRLRIRKNGESEQFFDDDFLVDSGAVYTVAPGQALERIGVRPREERAFLLANGDRIIRKIGEAYFEFGGKGGTAKVIFGQAGDNNLLGVMTLEALEVILDPLKRELRPMPMLLM
jgi:predicted aspartyl protease